jgi:tetratricopeptide (TPR) repeat protein/4-amino-4-deoxy-L-arabinose transferase-like glycosyltransferase
MTKSTRRLRVAAAAAAAAAVLALGAPLIPRAGMTHDESWHAEPAVAIIDRAAARPLSFWPDFPLMRDSYNGALKTYYLAGVFKLFGASPAILRWATLSLGALAASALSLLASSLYGDAVGLAFSAVVATDPALILMTCFDTGPAALMLLLKSLGFLCLALWWRGRGGSRVLAAGAFFLGLTLSDKAHAVWLLAGLAAAGAWRAKEIRKRLSGGRFAAASLAAGASPFILFNILKPLATMRHDNFAAAHLVGPRWVALDAMLTGEWNYNYIAGGFPLALAQAYWIILIAISVAAALGAWRSKGRVGLRGAATWLLIFFSGFAASAVTPSPVKGPHLFLLYPIPFLALASLAAAAGPRLRIALSLGALCLAGRNLAAMRSFTSDLSRTEGSLRGAAELSSFADAVAEEARAHPEAQFFTEDGSVQGWLSLYWRCRLKTTALAAPLSPASAAPVLSAPLAVVLLADFPWIRDRARPLLESAGARLVPLSEVGALDRGGVLGAYRVEVPEDIRRAIGAPPRPVASGPRPKQSQASRAVGEAEALWRRGDAGGALAAVSKRGLAGPDRDADQRLVWLLCEIAEAEARAGRSDRAASLLAKARTLPASEQSSRRLARAYDAALGDPGSALALVRPLNASSRSAADWIDQSQMAARCGQTSLALASLDRALSLRPDDAMLREIALGYQGLGRAERALVQLADLARRKPGEPALLVDKAVAEFSLGSSTQAAADLSLALERDRTLGAAYLSLAAIQENNGDREAALRTIDAGLAASPGSLRAQLSSERRRLAGAAIRSK